MNSHMNFWQKLKKPIYILAPMDGVTDTVFRQIVASVGKPSVLVTEFIPVDALLSPGREKALRGLKFEESERPIVAQIWGNDPKKFFKVAEMLVKMGFDGIDINMGCPERNVIKKGACSALIQNPKLSQEIIQATIDGARDLPVSVKTRIGFDKIITEEWVEVLLQMPIAVLTLHLRTAREMSKVPAHWDEIKQAVNVRNKLNSKTLLIGNGDVKSLTEAKEKVKKYGIDGVMIGRGIFENVWLFNENVDIAQVTPKQKIELLIKHLELFKKTFEDTEHFALLKKFVKCYVNNFDGASETRISLMSTKTLDELVEKTNQLQKTLNDSNHITNQ